MGSKKKVGGFISFVILSYVVLVVMGSGVVSGAATIILKNEPEKYTGAQCNTYSNDNCNLGYYFVKTPEYCQCRKLLCEVMPAGFQPCGADMNPISQDYWCNPQRQYSYTTGHEPCKLYDSVNQRCSADQKNCDQRGDCDCIGSSTVSPRCGGTDNKECTSKCSVWPWGWKCNDDEECKGNIFVATCEKLSCSQPLPPTCIGNDVAPIDKYCAVVQNQKFYTGPHTCSEYDSIQIWQNCPTGTMNCDKSGGCELCPSGQCEGGNCKAISTPTPTQPTGNCVGCQGVATLVADSKRTVWCGNTYHEDKCEQRLSEVKKIGYYCKDANNYAYDEISCGSGKECKDGACVDKTTQPTTPKTCGSETCKSVGDCYTYLPCTKVAKVLDCAYGDLEGWSCAYQSGPTSGTECADQCESKECQNGVCKSGTTACGNDQYDIGEQCDTKTPKFFDKDGKTLTNPKCQDIEYAQGQTYSGGTLKCEACKITGCTKVACGADAECNAEKLKTKKCTDFYDANTGNQYTGGELTCDDKCKFDTSKCSKSAKAGCANPDGNEGATTNVPCPCGGAIAKSCEKGADGKLAWVPKGVCQTGECYGEQVKCVDEKTYQPCAACKYTTAQAVPTGKICRNNALVAAVQKKTPEGETGWCGAESNCLLTTSPTSNDCKVDKDFVNDNYCENGEWTSRTKFVASQLIDLAKDSNYILYCDTGEKVLNYLGYAVAGTGKKAEDLIGENTNNFCVLLSNGQVVLGTSVNNGLGEQSTKNFLKAIKTESCPVPATDDKYYACDTAKKTTWFNPKKQSVIYSSAAISIGETNIQSIFTNIVKAPFKTLTGLIKSKIIDKPDKDAFVDELKKFDKLYISKQGGIVKIKGSIDGYGIKNLVVEYTNFGTDMCAYVNISSKKYQDDPGSGIKCHKEGKDYYVLAQGQKDATSLEPEEIFDDLTVKLRLT